MAANDLALILKIQDEASATLKEIANNTEHIGIKAGLASAAFNVAFEAIKAAAQAVGDVIGTAVHSAGDLEQAVANISTIKPDIDTSALFASLNDMQTRVPQTAAQLGDALYNVFSSVTVSEQEALLLAETFAKGAVGAATDAQTFGTAAMGVMNAYGLSASDAAHISDVFFNTIAAGVVTGPELAASLGPVTQAAKMAGVSLDELGGFIAGVTKEGGPAAQNINDLNNLFQKVTTIQAQQALHDMGVATTDAQGKFLPLVDTFQVLKDKLALLTDAEKINALQTIFPDAQAKQGAQVILDQLDFVKESIQTNVTAAGAAASAYTTMSSTFNSQSALLKNSINSILTAVGAELVPMLPPLIPAVAVALPAAFHDVKTALAPVGQQLSIFRDTVAGLVGDGGLGQADALLEAFSLSLKDAFGPSTSALFDAISQGVGDVAEAFGNLFAGDSGLGSFADGVEEMSGRILAVLNGDLRGGLEAMGPWVRDTLTGLTTAVADEGPNFAAQAGEFWLGFVHWTGEVGPQVIAGLGGVLNGILDWISTSAAPLAAQILSEWVPGFTEWALGTALPALLGNLFSLIGSVGDWLVTGGAEAIITAALSLGVGLVAGFVTGMARLDEDVRTWITTQFEAAKTALAGIVSQGGAEIGGNIIAGVVKGIQDGAGNLVGAMGRIISTAIEAANAVGRGNSPYEEFAEQVGEVGIVGGIILGVNRGGTAATTAISGFMHQLLSDTANFQADFNKSGADLASKLMLGIVDNTAQGGADVAKALDKVVTDLRTTGITNWRQLGDDLAGAVHDALIDGSPGAVQAALQLIGSASDAIREANAPGGVWRRNLHDLANLAELQDALGTEGAKTGQVFLDALTSQQPKDVDALFKSVQSLIARAQEKGVPEAIALGQELDNLIGEAFANLSNPERLAEIAADINEIIGSIGTQLDSMKNKVVTPVQAAMSAVSEVIRDSSWIADFGSVGAAAISALSSEFETGEKAAAIKAVNTVQKMIEEAQKAGMSDASGMGNEIIRVFLEAIASHDPEALQHAKDLVAQFNAGFVLQQGDNAAEKMMSDLLGIIAGKKGDVQLLGDQLGREFTQYLASSTTQNAKDVEDALKSILNGLAKTEAPGWQQLGADLAGAWAQAMRDKTPESRAAAEALTAAALAAIKASTLPADVGTLMDQVSKAFSDLKWASQAGSGAAALMAAVEKTIKDSTPANLAAVAGSAASLLAEWQKHLPPSAFADDWATMQALLTTAINDGSADSITALANYLALVVGQWQGAGGQIKAITGSWSTTYQPSILHPGDTGYVPPTTTPGSGGSGGPGAGSGSGFPPCPPGQSRNAAGNCTSTVTQDLDQLGAGKGCKAGEVWNGNECVAVIDQGGSKYSGPPITGGGGGGGGIDPIGVANMMMAGSYTGQATVGYVEAQLLAQISQARLTGYSAYGSADDLINWEHDFRQWSDTQTTYPMAMGGIAMRPIHALIGEAGPELVAPLRGSSGWAGGLIDEDSLARKIAAALADELSRRPAQAHIAPSEVTGAITDSFRRGGLAFLAPAR